jgi:hypothetical protein
MEPHRIPTETISYVVIGEDPGQWCRWDQSVQYEGRNGAEVSKFDLNDDNSDNGVINELLGVKF